ncbi:riboflavin synthase [Butyrivibrio sp. X503]|uniref:riboflavin synthase n=1 Tax=Butyrivibrio sp. X503 TaxID=2364878 RepID=UPI000EAAA1E7|nr:riboflavin synthase [Butyrivibrio sp. X503]RKM54951.1 riboflavin synthase [Butyrivibrio sp. X503]
MFTGIVEEIGFVKNIIKQSETGTINISCKKILEDVHIGDSISVCGVCLTVTQFSKDNFFADVMNETFNRSILSLLKKGSRVNLERAMKADGRFGGHLVSGHIDGTGKIESIKRDGNAVWLEISAPSNIMEGITQKGSVAIDGISLTVAKMGINSFWVSVIPHTLTETTLGEKKVSDAVNLETDMIGKYVMSFLNRESEITIKPKITREFLLSNGF